MVLQHFIGDYAVVSKIGEGGMGAVFLAEDTKLGRKVAVKTMRPELARDQSNRERFEREARAAAAVEHESIVPIWGVGESNDGTPFIAMPFLKGEMLADRLKRQPVAGLSVILKVAREVAEGLSAAHAAGLIHRDIKPGNIWLEGDPQSKDLTLQIRRCKILDFGLARSVNSDDTHLTAVGAILGTPAYMAPEQARAQKVDHRTDLFSLGVTLYRMATGRMPFEGQTSMAVVIAITTTDPIPVWSLNPNLPHALGELIDRLMCKDPAGRPQSAEEVVRAVKQILKDIQARNAAPAAPVAIRPAGAGPATEVSAHMSNAVTVAEVVRKLPAPAPKSEPTERGPAAREPGFEIVPEPAPAKPTRTKSKSRKRARKAYRNRMIVAWAVALFAIGAVAVAVLRYTTAEGTLVVEIDDPDVEARFKNGKLVVIGPDGKDRYTLTAAEHDKKIHTGAYTLRIEGSDGLIIDTNEFTLKRGGKVTVRVTLDPKVVRKVDPPKPAPVPNADPDRTGAEYALSVGGIVRINGKPDSIKSAKDLPKERFQLTELEFFGNKQVTDDGMKAFAACVHITSANLAETRVSEAGVVHLKGCKGLRFFSIGSGDRGQKFGDTGLALLAECTDLRMLWMGGTQVTDAGLAALKNMKHLYDIRFSNSGLTDAGLVHLKVCKELTLVHIPKTKVTAEAVADFATALPKCRIEWAGGTIEPRK
jgi:tRNA A-37 threonylcarbamoyl transferase component Bud32